MTLFEQRRRELGMSTEVLVRRSGITRVSVGCILSYGIGAASVRTARAVMDILGLNLIIKTVKTVEELRVIEAEKVAHKVVEAAQKIVEAKFSSDIVQKVFEQTVDKLLTNYKLFE